MAVKRFSTSFISDSGQDKSSNFIANYSPAIDEMELISRVRVGSGGTSAIEFTNIPATFAHLQVRIIGKHSTTGNVQTGRIQFNGSTAANYAAHFLNGNGSATGAGALTSTSDPYGPILSSTSYSNVFGASILDILDYASATKATTYRGFTGVDVNGSGGYVQMISGLWTNTSAVSSIKMYYSAANFAQHSTAALYGVKV